MLLNNDPLQQDSREHNFASALCMYPYLLRFCSSRSIHKGEKACMASEARSRDDGKTSCITPVFFVRDIYTSTFAAVRRIWMYTGRAREREREVSSLRDAMRSDRLEGATAGRVSTAARMYGMYWGRGRGRRHCLADACADAYGGAW